MLSTMFNEEIIGKTLGKKANLCKLNASILAYPVIISGENTHRGTMEGISGLNAQLEEYLSLDKRVTKNSVPTFIWTTTEATPVPMESSLALAIAYRKVGVPFELHVFETGHHGLSLCNKEVNDVNEPNSVWLKMAFDWLNIRGFDIID